LDLLGDVYLQRKDLAHARESFLRASALDPQDWQAHRNLALVALDHKDLNAAVDEYESAVKIAPAEPRLITELAALYEKQGRPENAIARYESLYESNTSLRQFAANNLAMLLVTYRTDAASLDRARDLIAGFTSTSNSSLLDTIGWVRFKRGEYGDAVTFLERAVAGAPSSKVIHYHLGMAELQVGQRARARSDLETALDGSDGGFAGAEEARVALANLKASSG
jgi:Flp pilus assembly protein TadD